MMSTVYYLVWILGTIHRCNFISNVFVTFFFYLLFCYTIPNTSAPIVSHCSSSLLTHHFCLLFIQRIPIDGFVPVSALLSLPQFRSFSLSDIERVVGSNDKQRFMLRSLEPEKKLEIRANQGHSLQVMMNNTAFGCQLRGLSTQMWYFS